MRIKPGCSNPVLRELSFGILGSEFKVVITAFLFVFVLTGTLSEFEFRFGSKLRDPRTLVGRGNSFNYD